jgi:hypothetical protein
MFFKANSLNLGFPLEKTQSYSHSLVSMLQEELLTKNSHHNKVVTPVFRKQSEYPEKTQCLRSHVSGHICNFYKSKDALADILVPYFASGLARNQSCIWVTSPYLDANEAKSILENVVINFNGYVAKKQIKIIPYDLWYFKNKKFDRNKILKEWRIEEQNAINRGFQGLRLNTDNFWVHDDIWKLFVEYERTIDTALANRNVTALCSYYTGNCTCTEIADILQNHVGFLATTQKKSDGGKT